MKRIFVLAIVAACGGGSSGGDTVIPDTTHVLDDQARAALVSYGADGTLVATAPTLADLSPGDIVVSAPAGTVAPQGFLRKVVSVNQSGGQVTVATGPATLSEAIQTGTAQGDMPITADMIDMTHTTTKDPSISIGAPAPLRSLTGMIPAGHGLQITFDHTHLTYGGHTMTITGNVVVDPTFHFDLQLDWFKVTHFLVGVDLAEDSNVTLDGDFAFSAGPEPEITTMWLTPIDIQVGPVPVMITPKLVFKFGVQPTVSISLADFHFTSSASASASAEYSPDTDWVTSSTSQSTGTLDMAAFPQFGLTIDAYGRLESEFLLYDTLGPYVWTDVGPVLDAATPRHPFAKLGIHVRAGLGGRFDLIDESLLNVIDYAPQVLDETVWFYETPNLPPIVDLHDPPVAGETLPVGHLLHLNADAYDLEDGPITDGHLTVAWTSDLDGPLATGTSGLVALPAGPGTRTITVTATDSDGAVTTRTSPVTVEHPLPDGSIGQPSMRTPVETGRNLPLSAQVSDAFFPATDVCTVNGFSFAWSSDHAADVIANPTACPTTGTTIRFADAGVTRTITLTVTDPWGGLATITAIYTPEVPQHLCPTISSPTPNQAFSGDGSGRLTTPISLAGALDPSCSIAPVGTVTYSWSGIGHLNSGATAEAAIGTGASRSWQPLDDTPSILDQAEMGVSPGETIDVEVDVADQGGHTGAISVPITLASTPG